MFTAVQLKKFNLVAHKNNFLKELQKIDKKIHSLNDFSTKFETTLEKKFNTIAVSSSSNFEDIIFETIIQRLEILEAYKPIAIKLYLESQRDPKIAVIFLKTISKFFISKKIKSWEIPIALVVYGLSFNIWIEDDRNLEKTMAFIGNFFQNLGKIKSLVKF